MTREDHSSGKKLHMAASSLPRQLVEFEFDANDVLYARIDRKRKMLASIILRAVGFSKDEQILELFL